MQTAVIILAGRGGGGDTSQGVEITSANEVVAGSTLNLSATLTFATTTAPTFTWTIRSNTNIASINGDILTGIAPGDITLVATYGSRTGTQRFTVTPVPPVIRPTITTAFNAPVATGVPNQVQISWAAVAGATGYTLYRTTDNLSNLVDSNPDNLSATNQLTATVTTNSNADVLLSGTDKWYFLVTATTNGIESKTNGAQTVATAHPLEFLTVVGGTDGGTLTGTVWMDRNLGAAQVAQSATDTDAYGNYYQWGRAADGHQISTSTTTAILATNISPNHAQFITGSNNWVESGVDDNGALRTTSWSRIDGSSICPTGFRVPTRIELGNERLTWTSNDVAGAFASNLKLPTAGGRNNTNGQLANVSTGRYWTTFYGGNSVDYLLISTGSSLTAFFSAAGYSVRCIQN